MMQRSLETKSVSEWVVQGEEARPIDRCLVVANALVYSQRIATRRPNRTGDPPPMCRAYARAQNRYAFRAFVNKPLINVGGDRGTIEGESPSLYKRSE